MICKISATRQSYKTDQNAIFFSHELKIMIKSLFCLNKKLNLCCVLDGKPAAESALFIFAVMPSVSWLWNQKLNSIVSLKLQFRLPISRVWVRCFDTLFVWRLILHALDFKTLFRKSLLFKKKEQNDKKLFYS